MYSNIDDIINVISKTNKRIFIGISGIPGSGKTTFASSLKQKLNCKIIPLDGYHLYRNQLNDDQIFYRGRYDTFNMNKFKNDFISLYNNPNDNFYFPSFEHSIKDPIENNILITKDDNIIIFEGLYLFISELNLSSYFDFKIFLVTDINESMKRVALRNYKSGISNTLEESIVRTEENDRKNANYVLNNSDISDYTYLINYIELD